MKRINCSISMQNILILRSKTAPSPPEQLSLARFYETRIPEFLSKHEYNSSGKSNQCVLARPTTQES